MKSKSCLLNRVIFPIIVSTILLITVITYGLSRFGFIVNTTSSIPVGLYLKTKEALKREGFVLLCPPEMNNTIKLGRKRGYIGMGRCAGGYGFLMKEIAGIPGDHIVINQNGVFVNNKMLKNSKPLTIDAHKRLMPVLNINKVLDQNELLIMGLDNPASFDSRYFGVINMSDVVSGIKPLIIYK